jgi:hypothetical protein
VVTPGVGVDRTPLGAEPGDGVVAVVPVPPVLVTGVLVRVAVVSAAFTGVEAAVVVTGPSVVIAVRAVAPPGATDEGGGSTSGADGVAPEVEGSGGTLTVVEGAAGPASTPDRLTGPSAATPAVELSAAAEWTIHTTATVATTTAVIDPTTPTRRPRNPPSRRSATRSDPFVRG